MNLRILLLIGLFCTGSIYAQQALELRPLADENVLLSEWKRQRMATFKNNEVCPVQVLGLPFFDDFANNPSGYYPDCAKWQDNHVFVNQTMAFQPPSIGVATFDGLNPDGAPYDRTASVAIPSPADTLTSQIIDLSTYNNNSQIILSYFYQPMGLADIPEEDDSLLLEFLDTSGTWQLMRSYAGLSDTTTVNARIPFQQAFVAIADSAFLHANFQFRFRNLGSITGNNDHWHLDYVYIDANRTDTIPVVHYSDICFTAPPPSPLGIYTALPWRQFSSDLWDLNVEMETYNHASLTGTLDRRYLVEDTAAASPQLLNSQIPALTYGPSPNQNDVYNSPMLSSFAAFSPTEATQLKSTYIIENPTDFQNNPIFSKSDTAYTTTDLSNYMAYDDGTAETRIVAAGVGTQVAVKFTCLADDTLRGIYFHMPHFRNRDNEDDFINVKVWADSLGSVGSELFSRDIFRLRYVEGFNGYYYVELADFAGTPTPIGFSANTTFYVGWQQASTNEVPVGFDRNIDHSDKTFVKVGGNAWQSSTIYGTIMMRPLFSPDADPFIIPVEQIEAGQNFDFTIFPNPCQDYLNIAYQQEEANLQVRIFNHLGQLVHAAPLRKQLHIAEFSAGIYQCSIWKNGTLIGTQAFVKLP